MVLALVHRLFSFCGPLAAFSSGSTPAWPSG